MALGQFTSINPSAYTDPATGKPLAAISPGELANFTKDLLALATSWGGESVQALVEKFQYETLVLCRNVMSRASQPYLGAYSNGNEIVMRMLCPIDLAFTIEEIWDLDLSARTIGDIYGYQTGGASPANDTIGIYEGNIIMGFLDRTPLPGFAKYQFLKGGKTYAYFPLNFDTVRDDALPLVSLMAPLMEFPEESVRIQCDVARTALNPARMQAVGLHFCRASAITTATGSA